MTTFRRLIGKVPLDMKEGAMQSRAERRAGGVWLSLGPDVLAGLTLWGVLVPEGLAYAGMAGMPLQAGLYTLLLSMPLYFLLGGSPVLVCAATSAESIMLATVISPLAKGDPVRYAGLTALLVLSIGSIFLLAGWLRFGRVSAFLSKPVLTGFVFGLAIYIAASQLHTLFGLPRGHGDTLQQLWQLARNVGHCNVAALCVGAAALSLLFVLERLMLRVPAGLCVLVFGLGVSRLFELSTRHGVATVHAFPAGLPSLVVPAFGPAEIRALLPAAAGLALVAFSQALGAAEAYAVNAGQRVDANRELKALGVANLGSAFFGGLLAGGSMSSTAVNVAAGATSRFSSLVAAVLVGLTLCYLTPVFQGLPEAVLGAVVLHAVTRLMKVNELRRYYDLNRNEFLLALMALGGVVLLDILPGLVVAVAASLLRLVIYASNVSLSILGELRGCGVTWVDTGVHPEARERAGVRVLRMEGELFFANAAKFRGTVLQLQRQVPAVRALVLQFRSNRRLCITSADMLLDLVQEFKKDSVQLAFVDLAPKVLHVLRQSGVAALVGEEHCYMTIDEAVASLGAREAL